MPYVSLAFLDWYARFSCNWSTALLAPCRALWPASPGLRAANLCASLDATSASFCCLDFSRSSVAVWHLAAVERVAFHSSHHYHTDVNSVALRMCASHKLLCSSFHSWVSKIWGGMACLLDLGGVISTGCTASVTPKWSALPVPCQRV